VLFVGDDWAEDHHDVEIVDSDGKRLGRARLPEGMTGMTRLHALIAEHLDEADLDSDTGMLAAGRVVVGIETDRGPWVAALLVAGYQVFAINPMSAARYRERHTTSGAKSDPGDAHVLAEIVPLDREHHRPVAGNSGEVEGLKLIARTHQSLIWDRTGSCNACARRCASTTPACSRPWPRPSWSSAIRTPGRPGSCTTTGSSTRSGVKPELRYPPVPKCAPSTTTSAPRRWARAALRQFANGLVGILHGCRASGWCYEEDTAWPRAADLAAGLTEIAAARGRRAEPPGGPVFPVGLPVLPGLAPAALHARGSGSACAGG
jgi:hypothetical protein